MKKVIILLTIFLITASSVFAATVNRNMPSRIAPEEELTVSFDISNAVAGKVFALEDSIPTGLSIASWDVTGATETKDNIQIREKDNRFGWVFTPSSTSAKVTYTISIPESADGSYTFDAVWFDSSGQSRDSSTLTVRTVTCGDGICENGENSDNCEADCPKPATPTETPTPEPTTAPTPELISEPEEKGGKGWLIILVIVIIGVIGYIIFSKKRD